ncbi:hypothetical protein GOBAR_AA34033 [Gossypium barbadense]|uniref:Uncharacterized protein n=1 Tax=Gossypium barbadense TaxID=3634 RepID=A0A2P5W6F1_GOSBA|nr:hypothetical protein GOBAR_AA34033 [Gossypium barbadense]
MFARALATDQGRLVARVSSLPAWADQVPKFAMAGPDGGPSTIHSHQVAVCPSLPGMTNLLGCTMSSQALQHRNAAMTVSGSRTIDSFLGLYLRGACDAPLRTKGPRCPGGILSFVDISDLALPKHPPKLAEYHENRTWQWVAPSRTGHEMGHVRQCLWDNPLIITEVKLGPDKQYMPFRSSSSQLKFRMLRDRLAQMPSESRFEQISKCSTKKYEELQQQLRAEAAEREATAVAREAEARAMVAEQSKKYDDLQLQLQQMMHMFQQSQKPPS